MNIFKKRGVAVLVAMLVIAASIGIGQWRKPTAQYPAKPERPSVTELDTTLPTEKYEQYVYDQAGVLSPSAERAMQLYNANWDYRYHSIVAVITVKTVPGGNIEEFAWDEGAGMKLGEGDAILALSVDDGAYFVAPGNDFSTILSNKAVDEFTKILEGNFDSARYEDGMLEFYTAMNRVYWDNFGLGNAENDYEVDTTPAASAWRRAFSSWSSLWSSLSPSPRPSTGPGTIPTTAGITAWARPL